MSQSIPLAVTAGPTGDYPPGPYRFSLHDQGGHEGAAPPQTFGTLPTSVTFLVPNGVGWTVRGVMLTDAGSPVGAVVTSAPFSVEAVQRVTIGAISMIVG